MGFKNRNYVVFKIWYISKVTKTPKNLCQEFQNSLCLYKTNIKTYVCLYLYLFIHVDLNKNIISMKFSSANLKG